MVEYRKYKAPPPLVDEKSVKNETEEEQGSGDDETSEEKGKCSTVYTLSNQNDLANKSTEKQKF